MHKYGHGHSICQCQTSHPTIRLDEKKNKIKIKNHQSKYLQDNNHT